MTTDPRVETLSLTTGPYRTQPIPNQLFMAIEWLININVPYKLHPYSLKWTRLPPGPHFLKRIGNTHLRNYYNLKGKDIDVYFLFWFCLLLDLASLVCDVNRWLISRVLALHSVVDLLVQCRILGFVRKMLIIRPRESSEFYLLWVAVRKYLRNDSQNLEYRS